MNYLETQEGVIIPLHAILEIGMVEPHTEWCQLPSKWWHLSPHFDYIPDGKWFYLIETAVRKYRMVFSSLEEAEEGRLQLIEGIRSERLTDEAGGKP